MVPCSKSQYGEGYQSRPKFSCAIFFTKFFLFGKCNNGIDFKAMQGLFLIILILTCEDKSKFQEVVEKLGTHNCQIHPNRKYHRQIIQYRFHCEEFVGECIQSPENSSIMLYHYSTACCIEVNFILEVIK